MNKILRITTPEGVAHDLPNNPSTRVFYEKLNSQQKDESKKYKIKVIDAVKPSKPSKPSKVIDTVEPPEPSDAGTSNRKSSK
jgi:hypothetical protein